MVKLSLSEVLIQIKDLAEVDENKEYKQITVKLYHKGVILRCLKKGSEIKTKKQFLARENNFIISRIDARNGAFGIVPMELDGAIVTGDFPLFKINKEKMDINYFYLYSQTESFADKCIRASVGTTNRKRLKEEILLNFEVELPSLPEQKIIVENYNKIKKQNDLSNEEIKRQIFLLAELRQSIFQEALQGKLVPQDPKDEPVSELLKKIKVEKEKLVRDGKIKKEKPPPHISKDEIPYELPQGREWVRLDLISEYIQRGKGPEYVNSSKIPVISQKCIQWSGFDITKIRFISEQSFVKYEKIRCLQDEDLLWNSTGEGTIGRLCIYHSRLNPYSTAVVDSHVTIVRPIKKYVLPKYLLSWLSSKEVQSKLDVSGSTKQTELGTSTVRSQIIPLAPIAEQRRIVSKVEHLMKHCDELELKIKENKKSSELLMDVVLREAFDGKEQRTG